MRRKKNASKFSSLFSSVLYGTGTHQSQSTAADKKNYNNLINIKSWQLLLYSQPRMKFYFQHTLAKVDFLTESDRQTKEKKSRETQNMTTKKVPVRKDENIVKIGIQLEDSSKTSELVSLDQREPLPSEYKKDTLQKLC